MKPSSRTPEGHSDDCPLCGHRVCVEQSSFPTKDATCPHCGHLLWFFPAEMAEAKAREFFATSTSVEREVQLSESFGLHDQIQWFVIAIISSVIVGLSDRSLLAGLLWLLVSLGFGRYILPVIDRSLVDLLRKKSNFWRDVAIGWALVAGLPVGVLIGVLVPVLYD